MLGKYEKQNFYDENDNPTGGYAKGIGINITWQNGPLGRDENRIEPNGAFTETVIDIAKQRLEFYNDGEFKCRENSMAITKLDEALMWLNKRTENRENRGVEGTYQK